MKPNGAAFSKSVAPSDIMLARFLLLSKRYTLLRDQMLLYPSRADSVSIYGSCTKRNQIMPKNLRLLQFLMWQ